MITVVNIKHHGKPQEPWEVYVGRWNKGYGLATSSLANPFRVDKRGCAACIAEFKTHLYACLEEPQPILYSPEQAIQEAIKRLLAIIAKYGKLVLICWCASPSGVTAKDKPYICHGQVIAAHLENQDSKQSLTPDTEYQDLFGD